MRPKIPSPATKSPIWWLVDHLHLFIFLGSTMEMAIKPLPFPLVRPEEPDENHLRCRLLPRSRAAQRRHNGHTQCRWQWHIFGSRVHIGAGDVAGTSKGELEISFPPVRGPIGPRATAGNTQKDVEIGKMIYLMAVSVPHLSCRLAVAGLAATGKANGQRVHSCAGARNTSQNTCLAAINQLLSCSAETITTLPEHADIWANTIKDTCTHLNGHACSSRFIFRTKSSRQRLVRMHTES